jgi:hypothetical protein
MDAMWRFAESKLAWLGATVAALAAFVVATAMLAPKTRTLVDGGMQVRAFATAAAWQAESRTARCPRTPLREPVIGDGSRFLGPVLDKESAEAKCLKQFGELFGDLYTPCEGNSHCATKLAALKPHPEVIAKCAALYDDIDRVAHASEACSPFRAGTYNIMAATDPPILTIADAVRVRIAPLVVGGRLGDAAREVTDAIRFVHDVGRNTSLLGAMYGSGTMEPLLWSLDEILIDPRLTHDDAREIARDLDVLASTMPTFVETMHGEAAEYPSLVPLGAWKSPATRARTSRSPCSARNARSTNSIAHVPRHRCELAPPCSAPLHDTTTTGTTSIR